MRSTATLKSGLPAAAEAGSRTRQNCGDLPIRIGRDGTWFYHGSPIGRKPLVCLFARTLTRDAGGDYWLETPAERGRIIVEDAPFAAVEMFVGKDERGQVITFRTNVDDLVTVDSAHPLRVPQACGADGAFVPYVLVRDGMEAKLSRGVYYELVANGVDETIGNAHLFGVWSAGLFFPLGRSQT